MIKQILGIILFTFCSISCVNNEDSKEYQVSDQTKFRAPNSNISEYENYSFGEIQQLYNVKKTKEFAEALKSLGLSSLREIPNDTAAFRLIFNSWAVPWAGSSLSLGAYKSSSTFVEIIKLSHNNSNLGIQDFNSPFRQQLNYEMTLTKFEQLENALLGGTFWDCMSFEKNEGSISYDNRVYFIEARFKNNYKLVVREFEDSPMSNIIIPFLETTGYNDSLLLELKELQLKGQDSIWD